MKFDLHAPCAQCPFRTDRQPFIRPERAREITDAILSGDQTFQCHKTLGKGEPQHCAGATIMCEANDRPNQMMRIAERLGIYDRSKLKMESPVFRLADTMVQHHGEN